MIEIYLKDAIKSIYILCTYVKLINQHLDYLEVCKKLGANFTKENDETDNVYNQYKNDIRFWRADGYS